MGKILKALKNLKTQKDLKGFDLNDDFKDGFFQRDSEGSLLTENKVHKNIKGKKKRNRSDNLIFQKKSNRNLQKQHFEKKEKNGKKNIEQNDIDYDKVLRNMMTMAIREVNLKPEKSESNHNKLILNKGEISEKLLRQRKEHGKHLFKKAQIKKKYFQRKKNRDLYIFHNPTSAISEHFKVIRTILLNQVKKNNIRTILITSAVPLEGKSFVASNLAVSIAIGFDQHVLLIDCDFKRPSLQNFFESDTQPGLSDFLVNEKYQLSELIKKTAIERLSFLPSGTTYENSSELLSSEVMELFMVEVKYKYDDRIVIFDSAPAQISETIALGNKVDGIILVINSKKTSKKLIKKTIDTFGNEKIIGIILNYCNMKTNKYYDYYKYKVR